MKKIFELISIVLFFSITAMFGISALFFTENFDIKKAFGERYFVKALKEQLTDNFPMNDNFYMLYSETARLLGEREFDGIYLDKENDRLIEIVSQPDSDSIEKSVSAINQFHEAHPDTATYIMLVPTASGIYYADLPSAAGAIDQQTLIDEIYYAVSEDITPLDCYGALYSTRENYIYFYTDPHWTQLGAYEAYCSVITKLGYDPYTISNYDLEYTHTDFYGELSERISVFSVSSDTIDVFRCKYGSYIKELSILCGSEYQKSSVYSSSALKSGSKYSYFLGSDKFKCAEIVTTNEDASSILIIGSDYANCFAPFLSPHYSEITILDTSDFGEGETIEDLANPDDYDQVLFLYDISSFTED